MGYKKINNNNNKKTNSLKFEFTTGRNFPDKISVGIILQLRVTNSIALKRSSVLGRQLCPLELLSNSDCITNSDFNLPCCAVNVLNWYAGILSPTDFNQLVLSQLWSHSPSLPPKALREPHKNQPKGWSPHQLDHSDISIPKSRLPSPQKKRERKHNTVISFSAWIGEINHGIPFTSNQKLTPWECPSKP